MDPVQKIWMYENWLEDHNEQAELAKNHAYLLASFWNPEAVKELIGDSNVYHSTDDEFEETTKMVRDANIKLLEENKKQTPIRRRRRIKG